MIKENGLIEITVSKGETVNLGNYESSRIDISLKATCKEEDIDTKYEELEQWIFDKINDEIDEIKNIGKDNPDDDIPF